MDLKIAGKTALVTGSTAGIGFAIASELAREGVKVVINGRSAAGVEKAVDRLRAEVAGADVRGVAADLGSMAGVEQMIGRA